MKKGNIKQKKTKNMRKYLTISDLSVLFIDIVFYQIK